MSEPSKDPAVKQENKPAPTTPVDAMVNKARVHLSNIRKHLKTLEGGEGVNPYLWAGKNKLDTLEKNLGDSSLREGAATALLALPSQPDCKVETMFSTKPVAPLHPSVEQSGEVVEQKITKAPLISR